MAASRPRSLASSTARPPWGWIGVALLCAAILAVGGYVLGRVQGSRQVASLPVLGSAPEYDLTNQLGQPVRSSQMDGKVRVVSFLFPYCTTLCPLIAAHLTNFMRAEVLPTDLADKVQLVSINVDPEHTGLPEMRAFLKQYGWDPHDLHWQFLTGDPKSVRHVVSDGFHVAYASVTEAEQTPQPGDIVPVQPEVENPLAAKAHVHYDVVHNDVIELVDPQGRIRKIYTHADTVGPDELARTIRILLGQTPPASAPR